MNYANINTNSGYRIEVSKTYDFLTAEYSALFESSNATAFQSPLWLNEFYRTLVPGTGAEPLIIKIYSEETESPVAILPLVRETHFGIKIVQPADLGVADYNALIGSDEILETLAIDLGVQDGLIEALRPYNMLLFRKQRPETFDAARLLKGANKTPNTNSSYEVAIDQGHDQWLKTVVSKKMRKNLRRTANGIEANYGKLQYKELSDPAAIDDVFQIMRELRARRYESDLLSRSEHFSFYRNVAVKGAHQGLTSTFIGKLEDRIISIDFGLRHEGRFLFLLGAFTDDKDFSKYSLGILSMNELIRHEQDLETTIFDFTIGDEPFKKSFGAEKIPLTNVTVTAGPIGQLAFTAYQSRGPFRRTLKKLMPKFS